jgi:hypothetical protein
MEGRQAGEEATTGIIGSDLGNQNFARGDIALLRMQRECQNDR